MRAGNFVGSERGRKSKENRSHYRGSATPPAYLFLAKGGPNACGHNCDEWIAAEGKIDMASGKRFKEFLAGLPRRDLPVFFNSAGGMAGAASEIGASLREYRMSIGIGRTIPKGCDNASPVSEACRRLMQSKPEHQARLVFDGAWCASACVIAIAGGSLRRFDRATRLGIHALRDDVPSRVPIEKAYDHLKRYFVQMGVDPGIVDASAKISADSIHFLNASEILHFGLETPNSYETSWLLSRVASESYAIFKSVTVAHALDAVPRSSISRAQPTTL